MGAGLQDPPAVRADGRSRWRGIPASAIRAQSPDAGDDGTMVRRELNTAPRARRHDDGHDVHPAARGRRLLDVVIATLASTECSASK
jgi:hypothetical protein